MRRKSWMLVLLSFVGVLVLYLEKSRIKARDSQTVCKANTTHFANSYNTLTCSSFSVKKSKRRSSGGNGTKILFYNMESWFPITVVNDYISECTFDTCSLTTNRDTINTADAILYVIPHEYLNLKHPPIQRRYRNPDQPWIFMVFESPFNTYADELSTPEWRDMFNWSMSYRLDSDIHLPYGCIAPNPYTSSKNYTHVVAKKKKMAAWIVSNCNDDSRRMEFVRGLQREGVDVDIYGKCGTEKFEDEYVLNQYKFYLALENSLCTDYVTEKFFQRYNHDLVLIALGGTDYTKFFPTGTFVDASAFNNISALAKYILQLDGNITSYVELLVSKDRFVTHGAHPYGYKYGFCKLCEMVSNYDLYRKTYLDIMEYMEHGQCWSPSETWTKNTTHCISQEHIRQYKHAKQWKSWNIFY